MENVILINSSEFWAKHQEITRQIIKEELSNLPSQQKQEDLIVIDEVCKILHKSKQSIYNYLDSNKLHGYSLGGEKVENTLELTKKEKESLYFLRSDIYAGLRRRQNKVSHD